MEAKNERGEVWIGASSRFLIFLARYIHTYSQKMLSYYYYYYYYFKKVLESCACLDFQ
jgi:hypothetical protein